MYSTAIRRNEAKNLLPQHFDRQQRFLYVKQGKGSRDRVVPISERTIDWVERYENDERPQLLSHGGGSDFLFVTRNGYPWHVSNLSETVSKYIKQVTPDKDGSCHMIRRSVDSVLLGNGFSIRYIQEFLEHKQISTTQIYTKVSPQHLLKTYDQYHPFR